MSNVRVGAAISASFAYISTAWARAAGIMAAGVLLAIALEFARPVLTSIPALTLVVLLARVCIGTMTTGALYRIGIGDEIHPGDPAYAVGPAGFQWGTVEWRVLGANLLLGLLFLVPLIAIIIVWAFLLGAALSGGHGAVIQGLRSPDNGERFVAFGQIMAGPGGAVTAILLIPTALILIYVAARTALYPLRAADTGSFDLGQAWRQTRGAVLALIVTGVIIFAVDLVAAAVLNTAAGFIAELIGHPGAGGARSGDAGQAVEAAINAPLFAGLALYIYRSQRSEADVAAGSDAEQSAISPPAEGP